MFFLIQALEKLRGMTNSVLIEKELELLKLEKEELSQRSNISYFRLVKDHSLRQALIVSIV